LQLQVAPPSFPAPSVSHSLLLKAQAKTFNKITCVGCDVLTLAAPLPSGLDDTETWAFYERIHEKIGVYTYEEWLKIMVVETKCLQDVDASHHTFA
jgi:hypothetical protein